MTGEAEAGVVSLVSSAFTEGGLIPSEFTCDGEGTSPMLQWTGAPEGTRSFALIVEDPDAPRGTFVHWVAYDIPPEVTTLAAGVPQEWDTGGFRQGRNGAGNVGYIGPCPPAGEEHRYVFTLYALDDLLGLEPGVSVEELREAMEGRVLAQAQLVGRYSRTG
ncbi:MAG: YbhB/YbcL family Raf kinase inhibitor-like protein [Anaerolineae bacterium]|nr:YbhB/YbcL family Raf kinase inhibitor-like protein [Anaerolineae bacterium]